ncbi:MAG: cupin domain-containing protein [Alphaproteobacteria bacterium]|nr:cupin domain-containing protein [Alphaproteobacteria bacterium]
MIHTDNFKDEALNNTYFRKVLHTGKKSQITVMHIAENEDVGAETHPCVEQILMIVQGRCVAILDGKEIQLEEGSTIVVPPGVHHNFTNNGTIPLKIYTSYAPPNHIDGRIHKTKKDAELDLEDEHFPDIYTS